MSELPSPDPTTAARRRTRRAIKLPPDATCVICGISEPDVLVMTTRLIEAQHVLGEEASPEVIVPMCRNHHATATAEQHDQQALPRPGQGRPPATVVDIVERVLRSLAVFAHALAHALIGFADQLRDLQQGLDAFAPGWRNQAWAR